MVDVVEQYLFGGVDVGDTVNVGTALLGRIVTRSWVRKESSERRAQRGFLRIQLVGDLGEVEILCWR